MSENDAPEKPAEYALEFKLDKPLNAYGEEIAVLKLRKPTGADLIRVGNPVKMSENAIDHDYGKVVAMVARLASVPSSSLEKLSTEELTRLAWDISPFFIPR